MPPNLQPYLKGELVELRPLGAEDFDVLYAVAADPLIWEQHPESDRHKKEIFEVFFREAMESAGAFIIIDHTSTSVIGSSRYYGFDVEQREIEIGWTFLARSHWGGAYNREIKQLMLEHAFSFADTVVFLVGPLNMRSQSAVEKIGGLRCGTRQDARGNKSHVYRIEASSFRLTCR